MISSERFINTVTTDSSNVWTFTTTDVPSLYALTNSSINISVPTKSRCNCQYCGAPNQLDVCEYCGSAL